MYSNMLNKKIMNADKKRLFQLYFKTEYEMELKEYDEETVDMFPFILNSKNRFTLKGLDLINEIFGNYPLIKDMTHYDDLSSFLSYKITMQTVNKKIYMKYKGVIISINNYKKIITIEDLNFEPENISQNRYKKIKRRINQIKSITQDYSYDIRYSNAMNIFDTRSLVYDM